MFIVLFITIVWLLAASKNILFWIYLWQLKEYHIGRFLAHFQAEKGRKLLLNKLLFFKVLLALSFFLIFSSTLLSWGMEDSSFLVLLVFKVLALAVAVYFIEALWTIKNIVQKKFRFPVLTVKTVPLVFTGILLEALFVYVMLEMFGNNYPLFVLGLLVFDVLIPIITSFIVLFFQPLAVLRKRQVISRAKKKIGSFKGLTVIGITGSYGKTSTKEFLATILSQRFRVLKTKEHENSEMGISRCILEELKPEHQVFIVEMGAYNRGGIKLLAEIVRPRIGILTGINEQHLATYGSQENIIKTKFELIESLPANGTAVLNCDNRFIKEKAQDPNFRPKVQKQVLYSTQQELDIWAGSIASDRESISFKVITNKKESADFSVDVLGAFNASNILAAVAAAKELGMDLKEISEAAKKITIEQGGMVLRKSGSGLNIADFTYSANLDGVISALEYLKNWNGRKVIIMPCLIELDTASSGAHEKIGEKIAEACDLAIITAKDCFKCIRKGATENNMDPEQVLYEENPEKIMEKVKAFNQENDIILLEGRLAREITDLLLNK